MGKHSLPRGYSHFWTVLGSGVATVAIVTGTMAASPLAANAYADPAPVVDQRAAVEAFCDAAAERDYVTGVIDQVTDRRCAAQLIAYRMDSGQRVEEDWTWQGMPAIVGDSNEALLGQWEQANRPDPSGWLESYAATRTA